MKAASQLPPSAVLFCLLAKRAPTKKIKKRLQNKNEKKEVIAGRLW
jgi:hypothetical protein